MPNLVSLSDIADHQVDVEASLRLYFSSANPLYARRFTGYLASEVTSELKDRIGEADMGSALITLARVEAVLRRDYRDRCQSKLSDNISIAFRRVHKIRGDRARLDEDILTIWYDHIGPAERATVSKFRGMLKFRHWLAHGRYWNVGTIYSFQDVYLVADVLISSLPLRG